MSEINVPPGAYSGIPRSGLLASRRWEILPGDEAAEANLVSQLGISPLVARVLVARGMSDADAAHRFLTPSLERDWADPLDIPGMKDAADRVQAALEQKERIVVFGDFDVDGMTATCLLTLALRRLWGRIRSLSRSAYTRARGM